MEKSKQNSILEKWSKKYKRSIDCSNPKGFSQKAHCAGRRKRKRGGKTKSRPIESFVQEIKMSDLKKFVIKEITNTLQKEVSKKKIIESSKTLFDAVTLSEQLKNGTNQEKIKLAENAVKLAEQKLKEDYHEYDGGCDCGEGEGQMLKAQLLSIMSNAQKLFHMIDEDAQFEDWIQSKITIAEDYLRASYGYLTYYNGGGEAEFEDDYDEDYDNYDDVDEDNWEWDDEEEFNGDNMDMQQPSHPQPQYLDALSPDIDDDVFEVAKKKTGKV